MTLALKYRPVRFADVSGQAHVRVVLQAIVRSGDIPSAFLFQGPRGTGKTSMGRILAAAMNCEEAEDGDACGVCPSCLAVQSGTSTAVLEIDAASNGLVDDIRRLREIVTYSHQSEWRVILLDEAQSMSKEAFNALLKVLEEPPEGCTFILLTTEPSKIPDTVRSRSMAFDFRRLAERHVLARLKAVCAAEGLEDFEDGTLTEIVRMAQGGLRDALMVLDQASRVGAYEERVFRKMYLIEDVSTELFVLGVAGRPEDGLSVLDAWFERTGDAAAVVSGFMRIVRSLFVLAGGGQVQVDEKERRVLEHLASIPLDVLVRVVRVLWAGQVRLRDKEMDPRATLEMLYILVCDVLAPKVPIKQAGEEDASSARLTLEQMAEMT